MYSRTPRTNECFPVCVARVGFPMNQCRRRPRFITDFWIVSADETVTEQTIRFHRQTSITVSFAIDLSRNFIDRFRNAASSKSTARFVYHRTSLFNSTVFGNFSNGGESVAAFLGTLVLKLGIPICFYRTTSGDDGGVIPTDAREEFFPFPSLASFIYLSSWPGRSAPFWSPDLVAFTPGRAFLAFVSFRATICPRARYAIVFFLFTELREIFRVSFRDSGRLHDLTMEIFVPREILSRG